MATKSSKFIFLFLFIVLKTSALNRSYYVRDICINEICLKSQNNDYRLFFNGRTIKDSIIWNEYDEEKQRQVVYKGDSLYIFMSSYDTTRVYSKYIEICSSKYDVTLKDMKFKVGMKIIELTCLVPDIKKEYETYIRENKKNYTRPAYFGIQLILATDDPEVPFYPCQGLKFQIMEGIIIKIMIDFRTDGDLD